MVFQGLLDDFTGCESWTNSVDLNLHFIARFRVGDKDYEAFNPCDSVSATARFFDFNFVFFPFFYWLVEGTFIAHAFHLVHFRSASSSAENSHVGTYSYDRTVGFSPHIACVLVRANEPNNSA